jgi:hypothetical protein
MFSEILFDIVNAYNFFTINEKGNIDIGATLPDGNIIFNIFNSPFEIDGDDFYHFIKSYDADELILNDI